jgi:hypothetical protein
MEFDDNDVQVKSKRKAHPLDILAIDLNTSREELDKIMSRKYDGPIDYIRALCYCHCLRSRERNRQKGDAAFVQHVINLYNEQQGRCALSRIPLTWNRQPDHCTNISIDRIDTDKGYEIGNVRLLAVWVNNALSGFGEENMWRFVHSLAKTDESSKNEVI